ncbi:transcription initiation factor TFIID subunit 3-like [Paramacrobiotus metropolitanus]|uniref:transcription initiation factor TFIID subunit 3-like n=1 Tax=Paramacrobiotus metropolitanus TaxID=2943436 RepID=UPI0024464519|nr:transcription initiation factor TFIID subunit 3-like [Paramacrobiotus metropolitanus]
MVPDTNLTEDATSQQPESLDFRSGILRTVIAQQCVAVGWHSISESSLAALTDIMDRYLKQFSQRIAAFTHLAERTEPEVGDFRLALSDIEPCVSLKNLRSFCVSLADDPLEIAIDMVRGNTPDLAKSEPQEKMANAVVENGEKSHGTDERDSSSSIVRPEWMDDDILFPPVEPLQRVEEAEKTTKEEQLVTAGVPDVVIIADEEEDLEEPVATSTLNAAGRVSPSKLVPSTQTAWPRSLKSVSFVNGALVYPQDYALPLARLPASTPKKIKHDSGTSVTIKKKKDSSKVKQEKISVDETIKIHKKTKIPKPVEPTPPEVNAPCVDDLKIKIRPPKPKKTKPEIKPFIDVKPVADMPKSPPVVVQLPVAPKEPEYTHPFLQPAKVASPPPPKVMLKLKSVPVLINKKDKDVRKDQRVAEVDEKRRGIELPQKVDKSKKRKPDGEDTERDRPSKHKKLTDTIDYLHDKQQRTQESTAVSVIVQNRRPSVIAPTMASPAPFTPKKVKKEEQYDPIVEQQAQMERHEARMRQKAEERYRLEQEDIRKKEEQYLLEQDRMLAEKRAKKAEANKARDAELLWNRRESDQPVETGVGKEKKRGKPQGVIPAERDHKESRKETALHPPLPKITLKMNSGKDIQVIKSSNPPPSQPLSAPLSVPRLPTQTLFDNTSTPNLSLPENLSFNPPVYPSTSTVTATTAPLDLSMKPSKKPSLPPSSKPLPTVSVVETKPAKLTISQTPPSKPIKAVLPMVQTPVVQPKKHEEPSKPLPPPPPPSFVETDVLLPEGDQKVWICPSCGKPDDGSPMVGCDDCDDWFHWTCVGLLSEPTVEKWYCPRCLNRRTSKKNSKKSRRH